MVAQRVADAADRVDEPRLAAGLGLAAQVADVHVERVRAEAEVVAPDALVDHRAREHLARVAQEQLEQRELGARQLDRLAVARHLARPRVQLEIAERELLALVVRGDTAKQRAQPREQLVEGERLDEVVVRARVEPGHAVVHGAARGEHEDGHVVPPARRRRHTSSPSGAGIITSRTTAPGSSPLSRRASASDPSDARSTTYPSRASARRSDSRTAGSSSTTRTFVLMAALWGQLLRER